MRSAWLVGLLLVACECERAAGPDATAASSQSPAAAAPAPRAAPPDMAAVGKALRARAERVDTPGSPCREAYEGLAAAILAIHGQQPGSNVSAPDRIHFMAGCAELPEEVQRCMIARYAAANGEACREANAALSPETRRHLAELMGRPR